MKSLKEHPRGVMLDAAIHNVTDDPWLVGVLYVVYSQGSLNNPKANSLAKYLKEAAHSSIALRQLNPRLPTALSTTQVLPGAERLAFTLVLHLEAASASEPLWAPRLRAFAASPFALTLALDSHATACSPLLHASLLLEARRSDANRFDAAVNFEASSCLPPAPL